MGFQKITTEKGYDLFEVASTIQKSIRRGEEETALYFAVELYNSGYDEYLWKRLKIISSEDIGLAEPLMPATIHALYQMYNDQKKKERNEKLRSDRLFLIHAVLLLCRARKSRLVDWTLIAVWGEHGKKNLSIPDYAYDKHTARGRSMGRGLDHFYQEGARLHNSILLPGEEDRNKRAYDTQKQPERKYDLFASAMKDKEL